MPHGGKVKPPVRHRLVRQWQSSAPTPTTQRFGPRSPTPCPSALNLRDSIERPNRRIEEVTVAEHPNGRRIEIGLIGCEGTTGSVVVLGSDRTPHATYVQVAGEGYRLPVTKLRELAMKSPTLHALRRALSASARPPSLLRSAVKRASWPLVLCGGRPRKID
jgi:hypothetical protein